MTVQEIFKNLINHMIKGIMLHQDLANYYDFLNLCGYKECHEYHYFEQSRGYREMYHYYVEHFNKLIQKERVEREQVIPSSWYKHTTSDVDGSSKKQYVQTGMELWLNWEKGTKVLLEDAYKELIDIGQIAAAIFLEEYICDVNKEISCVNKEISKLKSVNYDMVFIMDQQKEMYDEYEQMIYVV